MNISAKELAKLINVSPATVSMVFNNKPGISDDGVDVLHSLGDALAQITALVAVAQDRKSVV